MEHCLVLMKPDAVELSLTGEVISHLEREDTHIVAMKAVEVTPEMAACHYYEHRHKPFFEDIIRYMSGDYHNFRWIYAFLYCGEGACLKIRSILGPTNPMDIQPGKKIVTLRQKYGRNVIIKDPQGNEVIEPSGHVLVRFENVVHASFPETSEYEAKLWFSPNEILTDFRLYPTLSNECLGLMWAEAADVVRERMFAGG